MITAWSTALKRRWPKNDLKDLTAPVLDQASFYRSRRGDREEKAVIPTSAGPS